MKKFFLIYGAISWALGILMIPWALLVFIISIIFSIEDEKAINLLHLPLELIMMVPFLPTIIGVGIFVGGVYISLSFRSGNDFGRDDSDGI